LATRLTLLYAATFVLLSGAAFVVAYFWIAANLNASIDADLREDLSEIETLLKTEGLDRLRKDILREADTNTPGQDFLRVLTMDGQPVFESHPELRAGSAWDHQAYAKVSSGHGPVLRTVSRQRDGDGMRLILGLVGPGLLIEIGESLEEKEKILELLLGTFAAVIFVVIVVAAVVGWIMARAALQGIEEITRAAEDVARGNFDRRVSIGSRVQEIDRLVETFNIMVDRVRALILEMRVMTDNIAHDLRSPLTRLRASVESALYGAKSVGEYKTASEETLEECDRLLQMINTTLDVTEAEGGAASLAKQDVDLANVIYEAVELFEPIAEDKQIDISLKLDSDCHVYGNLQYLQRMVANLLDNAIKYTSNGGAVSIEMARSNGFVSFSISDTGIGISPRDQARVFNRFFRCDASRSKEGFGLGLSFVRAVANAHNGNIELQSAASEGSRFIVSLPALST